MVREQGAGSFEFRLYDVQGKYLSRRPVSEGLTFSTKTLPLHIKTGKEEASAKMNMPGKSGVSDPKPVFVIAKEGRTKTPE